MYFNIFVECPRARRALSRLAFLFPTRRSRKFNLPALRPAAIRPGWTLAISRDDADRDRFHNGFSSDTPSRTEDKLSNVISEGAKEDKCFISAHCYAGAMLIWEKKIVGLIQRTGSLSMMKTGTENSMHNSDEESKNDYIFYSKIKN